MSMPKFPEPDNILSREQAVNAILTSIALEETALSHIINAEGEKIQYVLQNLNSKNCCDTTQNILKVNESVSELIEQITDLQMIIKSKMRLAVKFLSLEKIEEPYNSKNPCPPKHDKVF